MRVFSCMSRINYAVLFASLCLGFVGLGQNEEGEVPEFSEPAPIANDDFPPELPEQDGGLETDFSDPEDSPAPAGEDNIPLPEDEMVPVEETELEPQSEEALEESTEDEGNGLGLPPVNPLGQAQEKDQNEDVEKEEVIPNAKTSHSSIKKKPSLYASSSNTVYDPKKNGNYRIHLGVSQPDFTDLSEYETFYRDPSAMPEIWVEYFFFNWFVTTGLTFRFGYYKDDGHAQNTENGSLSEDKETLTELTLVPLQAGITFEATPFAGKWVVLGAWLAMESIYFQEVRYDKPEKKTATTSGTDTAQSETSGFRGFMATEESSNDKPFVNGGWKTNMAFGLRASFLLNGFDPRSANSAGVMGIGSVYATPYIQIVTAAPKKNLSLARTAYGLAFTFETL